MPFDYRMRDFARRTLGHLPPWLFLLLSAVIASAVSVYFFSPRFVLWQGLEIPAALSHPEVNRANDALRQLADPFHAEFRPTNGIIRWRLLFPLLGHYLRIPAFLYLALPLVGAMAVLGYIARIVAQHTADRVTGLLVAILAATTSWFFVSSGWLGYFDSWYILGLMLVTFSNSRRLLVASCLLCPWVDERFVLALPLSLLLRHVLRDDATAPRPGWHDALLVLALVLPFVVVRLLIIKLHLDPSESVLKPGHPFNVPALLRNVAFGVWHGLRGLWFFVGLLVVVLHRRRTRAGSAVLVVTMVVTFGICLCLASDVSRSCSMFLGAALVGVLLCFRHYPTWAGSATGLALVFNLVAPASHVMTGFTLPIFGLRYELFHLSEPPDELNPNVYNYQAVQLLGQSRPEEAVNLLSHAIRLKPRYAIAYSNRGYALALQGRWPEAFADLSAAIRYDSNLPDAYYYRAAVELQLKDSAAAKADYSEALRIAPADWKLRSSAIEQLEALKAR